jgi:Ni,Fe-hydrogenase III large subunit
MKGMIPKFVKEVRASQVGGPIQLSTLFDIDGKSHAILTDTENNETILSDVPSVLGEEAGLLLRGQSAEAGTQIDLDTRSRVEGYGVFTFPYGPVTSGIPEAGGIKFVTYGERVVKVVPMINFKKRGVEQKVVGMKPGNALLLVERSAGNFSASYSSCFATAVEDALGLEIPQAAKWTRAVAIELERIYNHLHIFSRESEAASQNVATYQTSALKERILRLNAKYFGHRYLFGLNEIGGVKYDLSSPDERRDLFRSVSSITKEFSEIIEYFLSSRIFLDRLQNTARLTKEDALSLGAVGPAARGSGIDWDDRAAYPIEPYGDIFVNIEKDDGTDAMARIMVRIKEIATSTTVIEELLDKMPPDGPRAGQVNPRSSRIDLDFSFCRIESPSGDLIQVVKLDEDKKIKMLHIRPASLANWLSFSKSLEGNVFTDFQFAFESFGLTYADSDR